MYEKSLANLDKAGLWNKYLLNKNEWTS
jgi:hypothetical protein